MIGGHDKQRIASKIGEAQMRVLAMLLMSLWGTPFVYMGDEIGHKRVSIPPDRIRDPFEKLVPGYGLCRDPERAPMRWDDSVDGGFSSGCPWLPLEPEGSPNVGEQQRDERSLLALFRALMALRQEHSCLRQGDYEPLRSRHDVLAFKRVQDGREMLIAQHSRRATDRALARPRTPADVQPSGPAAAILAGRLDPASRQ